MKFQSYLLLAVGGVALCFTLRGAEPISLDEGWRFHRGNVPLTEALESSIKDWRTVDLPHDWSIEERSQPGEPSSGGGGFFPTGTGWYRTTLQAPRSWKNRRVVVTFDGVSANATVWINGTQLGLHHYAYTPFSYDLTPHLRIGEQNTITVQVENEPQPNSRWYTGSGLYRHVWLSVSDPLHFLADSLAVKTSEATERDATIDLIATVRNDTGKPTAFTIDISIVASDGAVAGQTKLERKVDAGGDLPLHTRLSLVRPQLWSPSSPALYRAVLRVRSGRRETDRIEASFGVRTIAFTADKGFLLNGRSMELLGGNVHHDHGPLGAASYDRAEERKVELLKSAGFNAVRTAHNPPSRAFLDACDRLGMLVMDEAFDGWAKSKTAHGYSEYFSTSWQDDLDTMIRRDRNHPSVVLWSIGNEVYERGSASGAQLAHAMVARIHALDTTRPVTAGVNGMGKNGDWTRTDALFAELDVAGYNYEFARHTADHARLPQRVILGTESYVRDVWTTWTTVRDEPYVIGDFVWSAIDYLGEAGIGQVFGPDEKAQPHWEGNHFPWHGAACGDLDLTGQRKPVSHYRAIVWQHGEPLFIAVQEPRLDGRPWNVSAWAPPPLQASWTWPGFEGRDLTIEVYARAEKVRLYLNQRLVAEKPAGEANECKATFTVPYEPGIVRATIVEGDAETHALELVTAGDASQVRLVPDRRQITADGQDLSFVTVEITDASGRLQPNANPLVHYTLSGPGRIVGIGSADLTSDQSYQANPRAIYRGRALVVVRAEHRSGPVTLTATAPGLKPATATIHVVRRQPQPSP